MFRLPCSKVIIEYKKTHHMLHTISSKDISVKEPTCMAVVRALDGFTEVCPNNEWDQAIRHYQREFSGRITPGREAILLRYCQRNTWRQSCSCPGDCCGHCFMQLTHFTYKANQIVITLVRHYNY
jgi:hypothetical protein